MPRLGGRSKYVRLYRPAGSRFSHTDLQVKSEELFDLRSGIEAATNQLIRNFELEFGEHPDWGTVVIELTFDDTGKLSASLTEIPRD